MAYRGVKPSGKLNMIIASLVFETGLCRDDPQRLLRMTIRELFYWFDLSVGWQKKKQEMRDQAQARSRSFSRRLQK